MAGAPLQRITRFILGTSGHTTIARHPLRWYLRRRFILQRGCGTALRSGVPAASLRRLTDSSKLPVTTGVISARAPARVFGRCRAPSHFLGSR